MNSSSQTLPSQSHPFSSFQSSSSIPIHYSLDSSKPSSLLKPHQSPLQPLQLNTSSNIPISPLNPRQKHQISPPTNTSNQQSDPCQSPSAKSNLFATQNSPSIQKQSNHLLQEDQPVITYAIEKGNQQLNKESDMELELPDSKDLQNDDSYDNRQNRSNDLNQDQSQERAPKEGEGMKREGEERYNNMKGEKLENQIMNDSERICSLPESKAQKNLQETPQIMKPMVDESLENVAKSPCEEVLDDPSDYQKRIGSELGSINLKGDCSESNYEDTSAGRSRAFSAGEGREGFELFNNQISSQNGLKNLVREFKEENHIIEQSSLIGNLFFPISISYFFLKDLKKILDCLYFPLFIELF